MQKYHVRIFAVLLLLSGCASTEGNVNYGLNHYDMGLYNHAIPPLLKSVPELEKSAPIDQRVTRGYLALGIMAENDKRYEKAEIFLKKALETSQIVTLNRSTHIRNAHNTLGNFYLKREQYDTALIHLNQALDISKEENLEPTLIAIDLDNIALVHSELGEHKKSLELSKQALLLNEKSPSHKYYLRTKGIVYFNQAKRYELINENKLAEKNYDLSIEAFAILIQTEPYEQWRLDLVKKEKAKFSTSIKKI
ncbi:tetratricopeptide repeat protein [Pseudocolwellia sp. AS88]|uniref:tetratricopeptide repeat protein n=1 Tax=Pseudocolwellia sp. AS88 TaxID=3063958 RepID=UPI0026EF6E94|nr:tetratricopeptide repeat protein [Pseudocolwellia sp. AS88]MDO7085589.1 tetratricopeptide repeat protein [Pseudocolwellia sp. AS88]